MNDIGIIGISSAISSAIRKASQALLAQQKPDGRFEGKLSSSLFPTCAYAIIQLSLNQSLDDSIIKWLIANQNPDGMWGLDASKRSDEKATAFARLILRHCRSKNLNAEVEAALKRTPNVPSGLWIIDLFGAYLGDIPWQKLIPPMWMRAVMRIARFLMPLMPKALLSKTKPPMHLAPPVSFFKSAAFEKLFIAEKHTLVPLFLLIELNTKRRKRLIRDLIDWLNLHVMSNGSWFCVNFITSVSTLALIEAKRREYSDERIQRLIDKAWQWLKDSINSDGGCREALNLNVWDTSLSSIALLESGCEVESEPIRKARNWLVSHQNSDGGWAFSGIGSESESESEDKGEDKDEGLPSDADDTSLATLALLRSKCASDHTVIELAKSWLRANQGKDGSWSTYVPGAGDLGCPSVTSHAVEACLDLGEMERELEAAIYWLKKALLKSGFCSDLWLAKSTYGTATAVIALIKAGLRHCEEVKAAVKWLESLQNPDGGWGEDLFGHRTDSTAEQTGWCTYALLLFDPKLESAMRGLKFLLRNQREDGSWQSSCVGIYWEVIGGYSDPIYALVFPMLALSQAEKTAEAHSLIIGA